MQRSPFARAISLIDAVSACQSRHFTPEQFALANTPYRSRGKGRGGYSGKKQGNPGTPWLAHLKGKTNGDREIYRRLWQIENGILKPSVA